MKLLTGWVLSAGLAVAAGAAQAQVLAPYDAGRSPYQAVSDIGGPYAAMPPEAPTPAYGPRLLPPEEVYTVLRESGFSPLGIPRQRGLVYTISVIDRGGQDGRLVIDARTGRILRFMPANRMGGLFDDTLTTYGPPSYGPPGPPPPATAIRGEPRPPRSIPKVASRTAVPLPKAAPHPAEATRPAAEATRPAAEATRPAAVEATKPLAANPAGASPSPTVAAQAKPAEAQTTGQTAAPVAAAPAEARPAPQVLPTQAMPKAQGLD
jgi:hypothetical protein